jgi:hypothetical protein
MEPEIDAWLMLAKDTRQHGGNLGYDDKASEYYSWDSTVPNHAEPKANQGMVIWDGETLIGASVIQEIEIGSAIKARLRCPSCKTTKIKIRNNLKPKYRCHNQDCKTQFDNPLKEELEVQTYRSLHSEFWYDLQGQLDAAQLRALCFQPKSQFSMRPLNWALFKSQLQSDFRRNLDNVGKVCNAHSGHKSAKTKVRVGQSRFRKEMLSRFGNVCAFSGLNHPSGLDAAHLYSYAALGIHDYFGGLLLRKDLHRFFDLGLIVVEPRDLIIRLSPVLKSIGQYEGLEGAKLHVEINSKAREWLGAHWQEHNNWE